jgi:uncharacterized integral membrane protein
MFYLVLLLFLVLGGIFTVITVQNLITPVHLILFGWQAPEIPLGLLVLAALLLGALLLFVVAFLSARSDKHELKELHARIQELERRAANMPPPMSPLRTNSSTLQMPGMFTPPKY